MQIYSISPIKAISTFWDKKSLVFLLSKREILVKYKGSLLGLFWVALNPLFLLMIYTFVFSFVFKARWGQGSESRTEFALILFIGLIVFNLFAETINQSPSLIIRNTNYVKKIIFPLEVLPIVAINTAIFQMFISLIVWLIAYIILFGTPHLTIVLIPIVILPTILLSLGISWFVASISVYLRDISQFVSLFTTMCLFCTPIFYPITAIPEKYRYLLYFNPMTIVVEQCRKVLYWGEMPDFSIWLIYLLINSLICWLGFAWFQKIRKGFADVI